MATTLSVLSLLIAVAALAVAIRGRRRQLLTDLHATFISADASERRRKLHNLVADHHERWFEKADADDRAAANSALAQMDALAFQAVRGYVDLDDALMLWGAAARLCWKNGESWASERRGNEGSHLWLWLEEFNKLAERSPVTHRGHARRAHFWDRWL